MGGGYNSASSVDVSSYDGTHLADRLIFAQSQAVGSGNDPQISGGESTIMVLYTEISTNFTFRDVGGDFIRSTQAGFLLDASDATGVMTISGGVYGDVVMTGINDDALYGKGGDDVLEGGAGGDTLDGGAGIDTASYSGAGAGVTADLGGTVTGTGDAAGDTFIDMEKLVGSTFADTLIGNTDDNTLTGNGGGDALYGMGGNDRLTITDTPSMIDGGSEKDFLFVTGGGTVSLTQSAFTGIEAVYVRGDTHLHMSEVSTGATIGSQSTSGHGAEIIGTSGNDAIKGGKGTDTLDGGLGNDRLQAGAGGAQIDGGMGSDKIFAGAGADTLHFQAGFGRDNVYRFDVDTDHVSVDIAGLSATDIELEGFHGGQDTIVTFTGVQGTNKIILHDVTIAQIEAGPSELFIFGA
ncbi:calcium-binding protein [Methylobacterium sp. 10]|uniref:calcium-binding protein n=1 Tax=Methylobacterium sp. 10 TaxID=1101191 RepID=UPI001FDAC6D6|nr:calcium-binding protein [Methylobacterium sp. 10]